MTSQILEIKKELRANMNGVASAAMRQTADYRVNFGIELPRIAMIAAEFGKDARLAQELWKESVRECRILATLIQPAEEFDADMADVWLETVKTAEIAQTASLNLFQHMAGASVKAFEWIASDDEIRQIAGYSTIYHLMRRSELSPRSMDELADQARSVTTENIALQRIVNNIMLQLDEERNGND